MPRGIYTRPSIAERLWRRVTQTDVCWTWDGQTDSDGYGKIKWNGSTWRTHRIAWTLTFGPIPDDLWVLHHCDNPPCCRPDHLYLGTVLVNTRDAAARGLLRRGEGCHTARLTESQVREIRTRHAQGGISAYRLAREYGIWPHAMDLILKRQTWKHV